MQRKQKFKKRKTKRKPMVEVQYRTQMMFNMKMYVSNSFTFFCVAECVVLFCFVFCQSHFLVMQLLRHSSICKLVCTLNCSVGCSLDHSLGCILEYSLGCSLGCNLDCNQDRFLNYNVDCNEICNMKKVMQRKT